MVTLQEATLQEVEDGLILPSTIPCYYSLACVKSRRSGKSGAQQELAHLLE